MATLVASSSSTQGNPLVFNSNDTSNLFFGTSGADYLVYGGTSKSKLTVLDVSTGDDFTFDNVASTGVKARVAGNTVYLERGSDVIAKFGGLTNGENIKVRFSDGNFMTVVNDGTTKIYSGGSAIKSLTATSASLDLDSVKLSEADISTTISGSTVTVKIAHNGQEFDSATVDFSLFGGGKTVAVDLLTRDATNYTASYTYNTTTLPLPVILPVVTDGAGGVNGTSVNLVDTTTTTNIDFSDSISVTVTKGLSTSSYVDSVTVDNIAPVLNESLITTTTPSVGTLGTITVSVPKLDQLGNEIFGVTVDFSEFDGPSEVEAVLNGTNFVASATGTAKSSESDQAIVTAVDIVGNVTTFIDAAPFA